MQNQMGKHLLLDCWNVSYSLLDNKEKLSNIFLYTAKKCGATILTDIAYKFEPQGVSGVIVLSESHLSWHSWPERGYIAIDLFHCSDCIDLEMAKGIILDSLSTQDHSYSIVKRGF